MNTKIKFKQENDEYEYNPKKEVATFYQICQMKDPKTELYSIRKTLFNEKGEILKYYEKGYSYSRVDKFIKNTNQNKFKIYPVFDIKLIGLPCKGNLLEAKSNLLNNDNLEYDYAKF